jgi:ribosomal protein S18 acetylase RimI-like enzyme
MPLGDDPPMARVPEGIALRPFIDSDAPAVYRVVEDAFQEWRPPSSFERWDAHVFRHPAFSGELSRLAFDGDELVGVALATDYGGSPEGWVQQLATKASHRHRGIARAVLHATAAAFHARGRRTIGLSTDSRTGALAMYERLGMRIRRSYTSWTKELG